LQRKWDSELEKQASIDDDSLLRGRIEESCKAALEGLGTYENIIPKQEILQIQSAVGKLALIMARKILQQRKELVEALALVHKFENINLDDQVYSAMKATLFDIAVTLDVFERDQLQDELEELSEEAGGRFNLKRFVDVETMNEAVVSRFNADDARSRIEAYWKLKMDIGLDNAPPCLCKEIEASLVKRILQGVANCDSLSELKTEYDKLANYFVNNPEKNGIGELLTKYIGTKCIELFEKEQKPATDADWKPMQVLTAKLLEDPVLNEKGIINVAEPGCGKTGAALISILHLSFQKSNPVALVICPPRVTEQWAWEAEKFLGGNRVEVEIYEETKNKMKKRKKRNAGEAKNDRRERTVGGKIDRIRSVDCVISSINE
jgi:hypothetical protein